MSRFLELYVHNPLRELLAAVPLSEQELPELRVAMSGNEITIELAGERMILDRHPRDEETSGIGELPDDVDDAIPGP